MGIEAEWAVAGAYPFSCLFRISGGFLLPLLNFFHLAVPLRLNAEHSRRKGKRKQTRKTKEEGKRQETPEEPNRRESKIQRQKEGIKNSINRIVNHQIFNRHHHNPQAYRALYMHSWSESEGQP